MELTDISIARSACPIDGLSRLRKYSMICYSLLITTKAGLWLHLVRLMFLTVGQGRLQTGTRNRAEADGHEAIINKQIYAADEIYSSLYANM